MGTAPSFGASSAERLRGGDQCSFAGGGASTVYHHIHWAGAHTTTATEGGGAVHAISGYPHLRGPPEFYAAFPAAEEGQQKPIAGSEEVKEKSQTPVLERWASLIEPTRREERFALLALGLTKRVVSETRRKAVQRIQRRWHEQGELLKRSRWAQRERALEELYLSLSLCLSSCSVPASTPQRHQGGGEQGLCERLSRDPTMKPWRHLLWLEPYELLLTRKKRIRRAALAVLLRKVAVALRPSRSSGLRFILLFRIRRAKPTTD